MMGIPSFTAAEVELLESAVQKTLEHLRQANERVGGNDAPILETGRQYAVLLEKLRAISNRSIPAQF